MSKKKLKLTGQAASPDNYGRARILLLDELKDGQKNYSGSILAKSIPSSIGTTPYKLWDARDGVVGEFHVIMPKRKERAALFTKIYEENRSKEVDVEVTVRFYTFTTADNKKVKGACLDLIDIEPHKVRVKE